MPPDLQSWKNVLNSSIWEVAVAKEYPCESVTSQHCLRFLCFSFRFHETGRQVFSMRTRKLHFFANSDGKCWKILGYKEFWLFFWGFWKRWKRQPCRVWRSMPRATALREGKDIVWRAPDFSRLLWDLVGIASEVQDFSKLADTFQALCDRKQAIEVNTVPYFPFFFFIWREIYMILETNKKLLLEVFDEFTFVTGFNFRWFCACWRFSMDLYLLEVFD